MIDLEKLEELAKAATPGPWGFENTGSTDPRDENHPFAVFSEVTKRGCHLAEVIGYEGQRGGKANAEHIAAANPAVVLALIAEHRAALARIARVEALHRRSTPVFSWKNGLRFDDPCPSCDGKAGVHDCGCWAETDAQFVCSECFTGSKTESVPWPCATVRALTEGENDGG